MYVLRLGVHKNGLIRFAILETGLQPVQSLGEVERHGASARVEVHNRRGRRKKLVEN